MYNEMIHMFPEIHNFNSIKQNFPKIIKEHCIT